MVNRPGPSKKTTERFNRVKGHLRDTGTGPDNPKTALDIKTELGLKTTPHNLKRLLANHSGKGVVPAPGKGFFYSRKDDPDAQP